MRKVTLGNPVVYNTHRTQLRTEYSLGAITLDVLSNVSYADNDLIVIGQPGEEHAELEIVDSLTAKNTITLESSLNFSHPKDTPVYKVPWDFVQIQTKTPEDGDNWVALTESPIQWDKRNTVYYHEAGTSRNQYRFRFFKSNESVYGEKYAEWSPTVSGAGFNRDQVGYMIREVRTVSNDTQGKILGDRGIIRAFNKAQDIIRAAKDDWLWLKKTDSTVTTTASDNEYPLPDAIGNTGNVSDIRYHLDDGSVDEIYALKFLPENEFDALDQDQDRGTDDHLTHYTFKEGDDSNPAGYIRVFPTPKTTGYGTFLIRHHIEIVDLDLVTDTTVIPIPSLLEDFAIAQIERIRGNDARARLYERWLLSDDPKVTPPGIANLMRLDANRKRPSGQPMALKRFRGRRGLHNFYNNRLSDVSQIDDIRERYF